MKPFEVPVNSKYGAPMGRHSDNPANLEGTKCHLARVPFVDGDYDPGGAYWGAVPGEHLWCAWNDEATCYVRAPTRDAAKTQLEGALFFK